MPTCLPILISNPDPESGSYPRARSISQPTSLVLVAMPPPICNQLAPWVGYREQERKEMQRAEFSVSRLMGCGCRVQVVWVFSERKPGRQPARQEWFAPLACLLRLRFILQAPDQHAASFASLHLHAPEPPPTTHAQGVAHGRPAEVANFILASPGGAGSSLSATGLLLLLLLPSLRTSARYRHHGAGLAHQIPDQHRAVVAPAS